MIPAHSSATWGPGVGDKKLRPSSPPTRPRAVDLTSYGPKGTTRRGMARNGEGFSSARLRCLPKTSREARCSPSGDPDGMNASEWTSKSRTPFASRCARGDGRGFLTVHHEEPNFLSAAYKNSVRSERRERRCPRGSATRSRCDKPESSRGRAATACRVKEAETDPFGRRWTSGVLPFGLLTTMRWKGSWRSEAATKKTLVGAAQTVQGTRRRCRAARRIRPGAKYHVPGKSRYATSSRGPSSSPPGPCREAGVRPAHRCRSRQKAAVRSSRRCWGGAEQAVAGVLRDDGTARWTER